MRLFALALILVVGAAVVLWIGENLNFWTIGSLFGRQAPLLLLLICIPISLALFAFLAFRQDERLKAEADANKPEPQEDSATVL